MSVIEINYKKNNNKLINHFDLNNEFNINCYVKAIDTKNIKEIELLIAHNKNLMNKNNIDIILEIYNKNCLSTERFKFIIKNCMKYLSISSSLIKSLIEKDKTFLLDIIFNYI